MPDEAPNASPLDEGLENVQDVLDVLWTRFLGLTGRREDRVRILFTSPDHASGTTTLACCTALGLARNSGDRVALIETNFHSPAMASYLGLSVTPGLTDYFDGNATSEQVVRNSQVSNLDVLTAGTPRPPRRGELVGPTAREFFERFVPGHRYIVMDAPPVIARPQSRFQLEFADWVVLVLRARATRKSAAKRAIDLIHEMGVPLLGAIVNRFQSDLPFGLGGKGWN